MANERPIAIVGAGLAGLGCAKRLHELGIPFTIFEAADAVGGRVRTDLVEGFRLDRGFQIYLTNYPEGRRVLDYDSLNFQPFTRGALVRLGSSFHRVVDPRSQFLNALKSIFGPIGTARDKLRLASFAGQLRQWDESNVDSITDQPSIDFLRTSGSFSDSLIDRFFRPFFGGVSLSSELATSSRFLRFVAKQFLDGSAVVPALGMQEIPNQLARSLPTSSIRLQSPVSKIEPGAVELKSGERVEVRGTVVATEGRSAHRLLGDAVPEPAMNGTVTLYYAAMEPPIREPILMLNGTGRGLVNNVVVMSECSRDYAPAGQSLMAVSVIGIPKLNDEELNFQVMAQMVDWYGSITSHWKLLRIDRIPDALPDMPVGQLDPWQRPVRLRPGLYVCGDHRDQGSINGALQSGHRTAQAVAEDLAEKRC